MKCNCATWDRILRFIIGTLLLIYAIAGGPIWSWMGLYFLFTSAWGICPLYSFFKIKTLRAGSRNSRMNENAGFNR